MEMTQSIHFWYQILLKITIFKKNGKKSLFGKKKNSWTAYKTQFCVKNAEIAWKSC